jgi:FG-GAP repeat
MLRLLCFFLFARGALGATGDVTSYFLINPTSVPSLPVAASDGFGFSCRSLKADVNGDGIFDAVCGAPFGSPGMVYVLFMAANGAGAAGAIEGFQRLGNGYGGIVSTQVTSAAWWGYAVSPAGDIDDDGTPDLVISVVDGLASENGIYVLLMNAGFASVKSIVRIAPPLGATARFGCDVAHIGDLDGDTIPDIAVGDRDYGTRGAVNVYFLSRTGAPKGANPVVVASGSGGLSLGLSGQFGAGLEALDGAYGGRTLAVGARSDLKVYMITLSNAAAVTGFVTLNGPAGSGGSWGQSVSPLGDINGDAIVCPVVAR